MNYTVVWRPVTMSRLADLWMATSDRAGLTAAADRIDSQLAQNPDAIGEGREGTNRILIVPPLAVYYQVRDADRTVLVWDVWTI